jgi:excisionase family DNA binding protein
MMQVKAIPSNALNAAAMLLSPYTGGDLTPPVLVAALRQYENGPNAEIPAFVDKHKAAAALGVTWHTIVRMAKEGKLNACKVRGQWRIPAEAIRELATPYGADQ